jgi:hypothetical protein
LLTVAEDYSKVINEQCGTKLEKEILTVDLSLTTANISPNCIRDGDPHIKVAIGETLYHIFVSTLHTSIYSCILQLPNTWDLYVLTNLITVYLLWYLPEHIVCWSDVLKKSENGEIMMGKTMTLWEKWVEGNQGHT